MLRIMRQMTCSTLNSTTIVALIFLAACQSSNTDTQDVLTVEQTAPSTAKPTEIMGSGKTAVTMILPLSGPQAAGGRAARNGAALGLDDLSDGKLKLTVIDSSGASSVSEAVSESRPKILAIGSRAIELLSAPSVPSIVFATNEEQRPNGAFAFLSSSADSLTASMRYVSSGSNNVVFTPAGNISAVRNALSRAGIKARLIDYTPADSAETVAQKIDGPASVIAFAGNDQNIPGIVKAIRGKLGGNFRIVGNSSWSQSLIANPVLEGAYVARPDSSGYGLVSDRYLKRFGQPPETMSYHGYDYIAIISGILRAQGVDALNRQTLLSPAGFRGTTGAFRFRPDGSVERLFEISQTKSGGLIVVREAPEGF